VGKTLVTIPPGNTNAALVTAAGSTDTGTIIAADVYPGGGDCYVLVIVRQFNDGHREVEVISNGCEITQ
jgi:hypothetical protein